MQTSGLSCLGKPATILYRFTSSLSALVVLSVDEPALAAVDGTLVERWMASTRLMFAYGSASTASLTALPNRSMIWQLVATTAYASRQTEP